MLLTIVLIFYVLPLNTFAESGNAADALLDESGEQDTPYTDNVENKTASIEYEVEELREESVKHFKLSDGSYIAAQYNSPVHYLDSDGTWQDIDNSLHAVGSDYATSDAKIKFTKKIPGNEGIFTLHDGNAKISVSLVGAIKKTEGVVTNGTDNGETKLQKMMNLENLTSRILYADILSGVDLEYIVNSGSIKENIIVKERKNEYSYTFEIALNNLSATLGEDGNVYLESADGNTAYVMPAPFVFDAEGNIASKDEAYYTLSDSGNGKYSLTVTVDAAWMNAEERSFPVTVDPAITLNSGGVVDTYISSTNPSSNYSGLTSLLVGTNYNSYWKLSALPSLPPSSYITDAYVTLTPNNSGSILAGAFKVTTNWTAGITWNSFVNNGVGSYDSNNVLDYAICSSGSNNSFNITEALLEWYNGSPNYGLTFVTISNASGVLSFKSSESTTVSHRPTLTISYRNMTGVEPYYSYVSQSAGIAGVGSVNLASGKLSFAIPLLSTTDSLMPTSLSAVYNSDMALKDYNSTNAQYAYKNAFMPAGYKLNISETIITKSIAGTTFYVWSDADGTEHAFLPIQNGNNNYSSTEFVDEDGLQLELKVSSANITVTDNSRTVKTFLPITSDAHGNGWYLSSITDVNGNKVLITVDSSYKPKTVSLIPKNSSQIDFLTLSYNNSDKLMLVRNASANKAVVLKYSNDGSLVNVEHIRGTSSASDNDFIAYANGSSNSNITVEGVASYSYSNGYMISAKDNVSGYQIIYSYDTANKVIRVAESANNISGQQIGISYNGTYTKLRTSGSDDVYGNTDDIFNHYVFDSYGRAVSVYSTDSTGKELLGASYGEYEEQENVKNNLKKSATSGGSQTNYLLNGDFADYSGASFTYWTKSTNVSAIYSAYSEDYFTIYVKPSTTDYIRQTVTLPKGKYTLTASVTPFYSVNATASIKVKNSSGTVVASEPIPITENYLSDTDVTLEFQITTAGSYTVSIEAVGGASLPDTPNLKIKGVALTRNIGASRASLVEAGHIDSVSSSYPATYFWKNKSGNSATVSTDSYFGNVLKVQSGVQTQQYAKQVIYTVDEELLWSYGYSDFSTNAGKTYMLAAYAKATESVANPRATARIRIEVCYYTGENSSDEIVYFDFDLDRNADGWQFISGDFKTDGYEGNTVIDTLCVREISVICDYSYQPNGYALFDEISVVECTSSTIDEYTYYPNGLLASVKNFYYAEVYEYDSYKRVTFTYNTRGEYTEKVYNGENLFWEIYGHYTTLTSGYRSRTPESITEYSHNIFGQCYYTRSGIATYDSSDSLILSEYSDPVIASVTSYETTAGSKIFGATLTTSDNMGRNYRYYYDQNSGQLLAEINVTDGVGTAYTYDDFGNLIGVKPATYVSATAYATVNDAESVDYTYNSKLQLDKINTDSTEYSFTYDAFGNTTSIKAGTNTLASYTYNSNNGKLSTLTYGNGLSVSYVYDALENISEVWYNDVKAYEYTYTKDGQLAEVKDCIDNRSIRYKYDTGGRLVALIDADTERNVNEFYASVSYNDDNNIRSIVYKLDEISDTVNQEATIYNYYSYHTDGRLQKSEIRGSVTSGYISYSYDAYKRLSGKTYALNNSGSAGTYKNTVTYEYLTSGTTYAKTNELISGYTSKINDNTATAYTYTYDARSNITSISINGVQKYRYVYDDQNQLIREDNVPKSATYIYNYDNAGNITEVRTYSLTAAGTTPSGSYTTNAYGYSSSEWGDLLTSFKGQTITYDEIGNPISYYNGNSYTFTWQGRQLVGAVRGTNTMSFEYNADGIRTAKTVNGITTKYYLDGSKIIGEITPSYSIVYLYDSNGTPVGMQYRKSSYASGVYDVFFFEKNLQGDIVAVYGSDGTKYIEYSYDAWGKFTTSYSNGGASTGAKNNPFKYRGYYYDSDLRIYYLNSRYYDQTTRRFINADGYVSTGQGMLGNNMFAYCNDNPVSFVDKNGTDAIYVVALGSDGIPIVGHAKLYYQDKSGKWYLTHFNGTDYDKSTAKVSNIPVYLSKKELLKKLDKGQYRYNYLIGDYSKIYDYAEKHKNTDYGGYSLITNNCLHYVHNALNYGKYGSNIFAYDRLKTIIPAQYIPLPKMSRKARIIIKVFDWLF